MSKRVSHSLLDPFIGPPIKKLYPMLRIPTWFPPEGIVLAGHVAAMIGAVGFAYSTTRVWGGLLVAFGVTGNHFADCIDGTHARATNQCRNGGELLDHFTDPLSFAYWIFGWSVAVGKLEWGIIGVIVLYATAVLTNIKAKMLGEFTLGTLGPTEFKTGLVLLGLALAVTQADSVASHALGRWSLLISVVLGAVSLTVNLVRAVNQVNQDGAPPDTSEWDTIRENK